LFSFRHRNCLVFAVFTGMIFLIIPIILYHAFSHERLLCILPVTYKAIDSALLLTDLLDGSCDDVKLFTSDKRAPAFIMDHRVILITMPGVKYWDMRRKMSYSIWAHIYDRPKEFRNFDYFVKLSPDQLFIADNLRAMLREKKLHIQTRYGKPLYMGHTLYANGDPYVYGPGTYVLNRPALEIIGPLVQQLAQGNTAVLSCLEVEYPSEDDFAGFCFKDLGIAPADTRDSEGREFFLIFQARDHYERMNEKRDDWFWRGKHKKNVGEQCCAEYPVSFGNYRGEVLQRTARIFFARNDLTTQALCEIQMHLDA